MVNRAIGALVACALETVNDCGEDQPRRVLVGRAGYELPFSVFYFLYFVCHLVISPRLAALPLREFVGLSFLLTPVGSVPNG